VGAQSRSHSPDADPHGWDARYMVTYLLGAGFSKAFHSPMPLMRELGERVLDQLGLGAEVLGPFGGDLEAWLSYLANRQPWDDVPTSLDNEATFTRASEAIAVSKLTPGGSRCSNNLTG
jgi:hypothetical protein